MVRISRRSSSPRADLSPRPQWRLLVLVLALAVVVIAMREIRQPETVARFDAMLGAADDSDSVDMAQPPASRPEPPADGFRTPLAATGDNRASELTDIRRELLRDIEDNTPFRAAESPVWFHLLEVLDAMSHDELRAAAAADVGYAQLVDQPHVYRGRLVRVEGTARRVEALAPAENDIGLDRYYRLTLRPEGEQIWPLIIFALEVPAEFPIGDDVHAPIGVKGLFFKNWSYAWRDGMGLAPVVLAKTIDWRPPRTSAAAPPSDRFSPGIVFGGAVGLALVLFGFALWQSQRVSRPDRLQKAGDSSEANVPPDRVASAMQQLAEGQGER